MGIRMQGNPKSSGLTYVETGDSNFCFEVLITKNTYHLHKLQVSESAAGWETFTFMTLYSETCLRQPHLRSLLCKTE